MRNRLMSVLAVLGAVSILALAANGVAVASGGKGFLLGTKNTAAKQTTLTRTKPGPALALNTKKSTSPPFTTNATGKVAHLNADKLDGLDSTALTNHTKLYSVTIPASAPVSIYQAYVPVTAGSYDVPYGALLSGGSGPSFCAFYLVGSDGTYDAAVAPAQVDGTTSPGLSAVGVAQITAGQKLLFICSSDSAFSTAAGISEGIPFQIMVKPTTVTTGTVLPGPASTARAGLSLSRP